MPKMWGCVGMDVIQGLGGKGMMMLLECKQKIMIKQFMDQNKALKKKNAALFAITVKSHTNFCTFLMLLFLITGNDI